jgi:hypothetical protein
MRNKHFYDFVVRTAQKKPYFDINDYMERYWVTPKCLLTVDEYGNAYPRKWVPMFLRCRLHITKRADASRHLHDHPADNASIILSGWYYEQDILGELILRTRGDVVFRRAECFHRLSNVSEEGCVSLFFMGHRCNHWGFLVDGKKVRWEAYNNEA